MSWWGGTNCGLSQSRPQGHQAPSGWQAASPPPHPNLRRVATTLSGEASARDGTPWNLPQAEQGLGHRAGPLARGTQEGGGLRFPTVPPDPSGQESQLCFFPTRRCVCGRASGKNCTWFASWYVYLSYWLSVPTALLPPPLQCSSSTRDRKRGRACPWSEASFCFSVIAAV